MDRKLLCAFMIALSVVGCEPYDRDRTDRDQVGEDRSAIETDENIARERSATGDQSVVARGGATPANTPSQGG